MKTHLAAILFLYSCTIFVSADERQECRKNINFREKIADCIERGIYDPCGSAGSQAGLNMCAWGHVEVAERRIKRAEEKIRLLFKNWDLPIVKQNDFIEAKKKWKEYRENYCSSTDALSDYYIARSEEAILAMDTSKGFCYRRVTENHADELEFTLSKIK